MIGLAQEPSPGPRNKDLGIVDRLGTRLRAGKVTLNDIIYPMASFSHHQINFLLVPTSINHAPYPENGRDDEANGEKRKENR